MKLLNVVAVVAFCLWASMTARAGTVTYVYTDPQGTPLAEVDANGNLTATFDYHPYGMLAAGSPTSGLGYAGQMNDADIGLLYMQARYYDPITMRFLGTDPLVAIGGGTFVFNRYVYSNNNPVRYTDPSGRTPIGGGDLPIGSQSDWAKIDSICPVCLSASGSGQASVPTLSPVQVTASLPSFSSLLGISDANAAESTFGGTRVLQIENPIFSFPGFPYIRAIKLSANNFETHIKQRHAFDVGANDAGRFQRGILNRTTSLDQFSNVLAAMINSGEVVPTAYERVPGGLRLIVTLDGSIGTTPSGLPTSILAIGLTPTGINGIYQVDTAFPLGK